MNRRNTCHLNKKRKYDKNHKIICNTNKPNEKQIRIKSIISIDDKKWQLINLDKSVGNTLCQKILISDNPIKSLSIVLCRVIWFTYSLFIDYLWDMFHLKRESFIIKRPYELFDYLDKYIHSFQYIIGSIQCRCETMWWSYQCYICRYSTINTSYILAWLYRNINSFDITKYSISIFRLQGIFPKSVMRYILDTPRDNTLAITQFYHFHAKGLFHWFELIDKSDPEIMGQINIIIFYLKTLGLPREIRRCILDMIM